MSILESIYTGGLHAVRLLLPLVSRGEGKLARGVRGRRGALERLVRWGTQERDPERSTVWFHAPSVGEGLQARAVMEALRHSRPEVQMVYTYFSPSAESFADTLPAEISDYLPLDLPATMAEAIAAMEPDAIVFSKTEVWPNLTRAAVRRGVPLLLLSATLPANSSRIRGPARAFLQPAHARLERVGAISPADGERFHSLGVPADRIEIMGDARFDQVLQRMARADRQSGPVRKLIDPAYLTIIGGSTWPEDEAVLIPAFARLLARQESARLIVVPHEPTERHLTALEILLQEWSLHSARMSTMEEGVPPGTVLIVDRVGILGDLYAAADLAYVGGGFGRAGLHSVLEPAAFRLPVLFGPHHHNAREAAELIECGGGFAVEGEEGLFERLVTLLAPELRQQAGGAAGDYVESGRGAAERGAELIVQAFRKPALPDGFRR